MEGIHCKEDPESAISLIHDYARDAVLVCSVVDEEMVEPIIKRFRDDMGEEKYTIMEIPIKRIIVNSPGT